MLLLFLACDKNGYLLVVRLVKKLVTDVSGSCYSAELMHIVFTYGSICLDDFMQHL